jgi:predicted phosphate transport protein (TIGR00153 family)
MEKLSENYYFQSFVDLSEFCVKASEYLAEVVADFKPSGLLENKRAMHHIEHTADTERHKVVANLFREFITPIEREDILEVLRAIDDVTDSIEEVVLRMYMYNVTELRPEVRLFTDIIAKSTVALKALLVEFAHFKKSAKLKDLIFDVLRLEEDCDVIYSETVRKIFVNEKDPIRLFIWEDLFLRLENCCDACGHVSKEIETAMFKNL